MSVYLWSSELASYARWQGGGCIFLGNNLVWPISKYKPYTPTEHTMLYIDWDWNCSWQYVNCWHTWFCHKQVATDLVCCWSYLCCLCMFYRYTSTLPRFAWLRLYAWKMWATFPYQIMKYMCTSSSCGWDISRVAYSGGTSVRSAAGWAYRDFNNIGRGWVFLAHYYNWCSWAYNKNASVFTSTNSYHWSLCCVYSCECGSCYRFKIDSTAVWEVIVEDRARTWDMICEYINNVKLRYRW